MRKFLAIVGLIMNVSCTQHSEDRAREIISVFQSNWKDSYIGYRLQSRGPNASLVVKDKCTKDHWHIARYDSLAKAFYLSKDERFDKTECIINSSEPHIAGLLSFFSRLNIYQMDARENPFHIVQLMTSEEESIYYIGNYDNLPKHAIEWLANHSRRIDSDFFYVSGREHLWSELNK